MILTRFSSLLFSSLSFSFSFSLYGFLLSSVVVYCASRCLSSTFFFEPSQVQPFDESRDNPLLFCWSVAAELAFTLLAIVFWTSVNVCLRSVKANSQTDQLLQAFHLLFNPSSPARCVECAASCTQWARADSFAFLNVRSSVGFLSRL